MSEYTHFWSEAPRRCLNALEACENQAADVDAEKTLLLACCAMSFSFVRDWWTNNKAPIRRIQQTIGSESDAINELAEWLDSPVNSKIGLGLRTASTDPSPLVDPSSENQLSWCDTSTWCIRRVITTLRNGICHGQLWLPAKDGELSKMLFVASKSGTGWDYLEIEFGQLKTLAEAWAEEIKRVCEGFGEAKEKSIMQPDEMARTQAE